MHFSIVWWGFFSSSSLESPDFEKDFNCLKNNIFISGQGQDLEFFSQQNEK